MTLPSTTTNAVDGQPEASRAAGYRAVLTGPNLARSLPYLLVPLLFILSVITIQGYFSKSSIISLLILSSLLGLSSLGQTMTIIGGGIDLSIPSVIGLAEIIITQLYAKGWPFGEIVLIIAGLSILIGLINALSSVLLHVHTLITSFGMNLVVAGVALEWSHGATTGKVPNWLTHSISPISKTGPIPIPSIIIVWAVASVLAIGFMRFTRIGRETYAIGSNPLASRLARVRSTWTLVVLFCISALCASAVGIFFAGYSGTADPTVGQTYFFETITAVIIGGTSLLGGRGGYGRTVLGSLIVAELTTLLVGFGFNASLQELILGMLVVALTVAYGRELSVSAKI